MRIQLHKVATLAQTTKEESAKENTKGGRIAQQSHTDTIEASRIQSEGSANQLVGELSHQVEGAGQASEGPGQRHSEDNVAFDRNASILRSEERRVGKECRSRW